MKIVDFKKEYIGEATEIALENYYEEQKIVQELPQISEIPDLIEYANNGLGVAAFENEKMVGYLCCCTPFENAFRATDVKGIFSPMGANAAIHTNRSKIYTAMYQAAGIKWVKAGAVSHAICLPAHDKELQQQFFQYGFGLRCLDAIRHMELLDCVPCEGYEFVELQRMECNLVYPLHLALNRHYCKSPFFMNRKSDTLEEFIKTVKEEEGRYFVAKRNSEICAFLKISDLGETFVSSGPDYRHIRGAYCLPEYRGKGIYQNLLNFVISKLKEEGYTKLGVDFESFNPTARGFWLKYFSAYTNSVVRRIDERITQIEYNDLQIM